MGVVLPNVGTVEPPNKGHFGNRHFVLFSEAVLISEACHYLTIKHLSIMFNDTRNGCKYIIDVELYSDYQTKHQLFYFMNECMTHDTRLYQLPVLIIWRLRKH